MNGNNQEREPNSITNIAFGTKPPWWVHFAYVFGIPAVMALFMLWFITGKQDESLREINLSIRALVKETSAVRERLERTTYQNEILINQMENVQMQQQQTCVNTATDFTQRRACLQRMQNAVDKSSGRVR